MILRGTVFSETLGMDTGITVVAPNRIRSGEAYKTVYLLHGLCGNHGTWADYSMLPTYARDGKAVYILPEVGRSFYADMRHGQAYFTYIAEELPMICRRVFRVSSRREDTAVIGGSMGGYGALKAALTKPEQYGMCGAFSSACLFLKEGLDDQRENGTKPEFIERYGKNLIADFIAIFGPELAWKPKDELLELAKNISDPKMRPKIYIACGKSDPFLPQHERFAGELRALGYAFDDETWNGRHDFEFFNEALKRALRKFSLSD